MTFSRTKIRLDKSAICIELIEGNYNNLNSWFSESIARVHSFCRGWLASCHFSSFQPRRGSWSLLRQGLSCKTPYYSGQGSPPRRAKYQRSSFPLSCVCTFSQLWAWNMAALFNTKLLSALRRFHQLTGFSSFSSSTRPWPQSPEFSELPPFLDKPINFVSKFKF